MTDKSERKES